MTTASPTNVLIGTTLSFGLFGYSVCHTYKFDRCKCLIPRRKNLVRTTMVWLSILSAIHFTAWLAGLTYIKYKLGYIYLEGHGFLSWPAQAWPMEDLRLNMLFTGMLIGAFSLYDAVNLEEVIFWVNMIRSVRRSNKTKLSRWMSKHIMWLWLVLTIAQAVLHFAVGRMGVDWRTAEGVELQNKRIYNLEGGLGAVTCLLSVALACIFPKFIREVKDHGGSPDILAKLTFFNSMNRLRIVFRFFFAACMLILGIDATTKERIVNTTHISADLLFQVVMLSFVGASVISFMLYLPVNWSGTNLEAGTTFARRRAGNRHQSYFAMAPPAALGGIVTPGMPHYNGSAQSVSTKASDKGLLQQFKAQHQNQTILELMRSRGTIKDDNGDHHEEHDESEDAEKGFADGEIRSKHSRSPGHQDEGMGGEFPFEGPEHGEYDHGHAFPAAVYHDGNEGGQRVPGSSLPPALLNFQSPLEFDTGMNRQSGPPRPRNVVINVAQETETHIDIDTMHSPTGPSFGTYSRDFQLH